ncbi:MAG: hypothetical protein AAB467_03030 [Patescibacteria group bacterium]
MNICAEGHIGGLLYEVLTKCIFINRILLAVELKQEIAQMARKNAARVEVPEKKVDAEVDMYEEEYGPMQVIFIDERAHARLNGEERAGKWYDKCSYKESPDSTFCVRTTVPKRSLEDGVFHPDRFEPDLVAERCERVSAKEIARAAAKRFSLSTMKFHKGQKVRQSLSGAGVTTHTDEVVLRVVKGKVWLDNGPGNDPSGPYDAKTGLKSGVFGFSSRISPLDEPAKTSSKKKK